MFDRMRRRLDNSRRRSSLPVSKKRVSLLPRLEAIRANAVKAEKELTQAVAVTFYAKLIGLMIMISITLLWFSNPNFKHALLAMSSTFLNSTCIANFGETLLACLDLLAIVSIAAWFVINGQLQIGKPMTGQWISD